VVYFFETIGISISSSILLVLSQKTAVVVFLSWGLQSQIVLC